MSFASDFSWILFKWGRSSFARLWPLLNFWAQSTSRDYIRAEGDVHKEIYSWKDQEDREIRQEEQSEKTESWGMNCHVSLSPWAYKLALRSADGYSDVPAAIRREDPMLSVIAFADFFRGWDLPSKCARSCLCLLLIVISNQQSRTFSQNSRKRREKSHDYHSYSYYSYAWRQASKRSALLS